jgi:hypothetical protein
MISTFIKMERFTDIFFDDLLYKITIPTLFLLSYIIYWVFYRRPHYKITGVYDVAKKNMRRPPPPYPNGWYNLMPSN